MSLETVPLGKLPMAPFTCTSKVWLFQTHSYGKQVYYTLSKMTKNTTFNIKGLTQISRP